MKVVMSGGTGLIGRALARRLVDAGHDVTVLTRGRDKSDSLLPHEVTLVRWGDGDSAWQEALAGADAVVNLAGASIGTRRWTSRRRRALLGSRVRSTQALVDAIASLSPERRPRVLLSASAVDYYPDSPAGSFEESAPAGDSFLARVCVAWEAEAEKARQYGLRVVRVRTGVVLSPDALALKLMALPFRLFAGGPLGSGKQWFSWIHIEDLVRVYERALTDGSLDGAVNAVAPGAVTNAEAGRAIGRVLHRPSLIPTPAFVLRIVLGRQADLLLHGRRVVPAILGEGFDFRYPGIEEALTAALRPPHRDHDV